MAVFETDLGKENPRDWDASGDGAPRKETLSDMINGTATFNYGPKGAQCEAGPRIDHSRAEVNAAEALHRAGRCPEGRHIAGLVAYHPDLNMVLCRGCGERFATLKPLRDQVTVQGQNGNWNHDQYMRGMFNGLECALATLEQREPNYK